MGTSEVLRLWPAEFESMRAEARAAVEAVMPARQSLPPDATQAERVAAGREMFEAQIAVSPAGRDEQIAGIRCRVFTPSSGDPVAIFLHFHGGGMILGRPEMNDGGNAQLAEALSMVVISVDYRLAPEHPYPAGVDDCLAVSRWVLDEGAAQYGTDKILIGGESAGGYLALAVLLRIRDELGAIDRIAGANLVFGVFDWGRSPSQRGLRPSEGPDMLDPAGIEMFAECYLPGLTDEQRRAPEISPAFADLSRLPPLFFSVGTSDHLLDDTLITAHRAVAAGVEVELFVGPDLPHGFMMVPCTLTTRWIEHLFGWLSARLAS